MIQRLDKVELVDLNELDPQRYPYLLLSGSEGNQNTRYDILFAFPEETISLYAKDISSNSFLECLDQTFADNHIEEASKSSDLPFRGGWFVYLGYELAMQVEPRLDLPLSDIAPIAFATRCKSALILDKQKQALFWVCENDMPQEEKEARYATVCADIKQLQSKQYDDKAALIPLVNMNEQDPQRYFKSVESVLEYIRSGDVFQVNLSRPWHVTLDDSISDQMLFRTLRHTNPSPFSALVCHHDVDGQAWSVISSSPERLIEVKDGVIQTRPIAGTRPRVSQAQDDQVKQELITHPKERSEHIMLIDLERNDLGRVCQPGTVEVDELMVLETYAHVHHIVSNVRGKIRADVSPGQAIAAVFPGGTITGCPKVRCMEILAELEQEPRSAYTGSLGYLNRNGDMDLNILIRTMERGQEADKSQLTIRAGGGIVADSQADKELEETRAKARGMLKVFAS